MSKLWDLGGRTKRKKYLQSKLHQSTKEKTNPKEDLKKNERKKVFVLYLYVLYFRVVLNVLHSLQYILLLSVQKPFGQTLKKKVFLRVGQLGMIH